MISLHFIGKYLSQSFPMLFDLTVTVYYKELAIQSFSHVLFKTLIIYEKRIKEFSASYAV